jgi:hypothetical protein
MADMSAHRRLAEYDGFPVIEFGRDSVTPPSGEVAWLIRADDEGELFGRSGCDVTPLLDAYPRLESLDVRAGSEVELSPFSRPVYGRP